MKNALLTTKGEGRTSVPITVHESLFYAPVKLGRTQQMAQLDTGSAGLMVTKKVSNELEVVKKGKMTGAFQQMETQVVRLPRLSWLGKTYRNLPATVRSEPSEKTPFLVRVTLGNVLLLAQQLFLDLRMMEACSVAPNGLLVARVPMRLDHGIPFLELALGGRRVRTLFDTGAGASCLNARITDLQGIEILSHKVFDPTGASMKLKLFRGPSLSLGGKELGPTEYMMLDLSRQEELLGSPIDFIFGVNTMLRLGGVWELDVKAGQLGWG